MRTILLLLCISAIWPVSAVYANITGEYTVKQPTEIAHLSVVQDGSQFHGFMQVVDTTNYSPGYRSQTLNVTGTAEGRAVAITGSVLDQVFGGGMSRVTGTYSGDQMILRIPNANGTIGELVFYRSSLKQWNLSVAMFQSLNSTMYDLRTWFSALNNETNAVNAVLHDASQRLRSARQAVESAFGAVGLAEIRKRAISKQIDIDQAILKTKQDTQEALQKIANQSGNVQDGTRAVQAGTDVLQQQSKILSDQSTLFGINGDLDTANYNLQTAQQSLSQLEEENTAATEESRDFAVWMPALYKKVVPFAQHLEMGRAKDMATLTEDERKLYQRLGIGSLSLTNSTPIYSRAYQSRDFIEGTLNAGSTEEVMRCSPQWLLMRQAGKIAWIPVGNQSSEALARLLPHKSKELMHI